MTAVPIGVGAYKRAGGRLPEIKLVNLFLEKDPTNLIDGMTRLQRPGLAPLVTLPTSPVRGLFWQSGVFGGDRIIVSGQVLYRVTAAGSYVALGQVPGSGVVIMDASPTRLIVATGASAYSTDGQTVMQVSMPDGVGVVSVAYLDSYFYLGQQGDRHVYWIAPGETNPDPLSFFSAESRPGTLAGLIRAFDELHISTDSAIEVWIPSGDFNAPLQRVNGRLSDRGTLNGATLALLDNGVFWVGNDGIAYRSGNVPERISEHGIEERIRNCASSDMRAWAYALDGHPFYVLSLGSQGTFAYDVSGPAWSEFKTYNRSGWQAHLGVHTASATVLAGDDTTGDLYLLDASRGNDNGQPLERYITGGLEMLGKPARCDSFEILTPSGFADSLSTAPIASVRWSDDGGASYDSWRDISLGVQGAYGLAPSLRQLGLMRPPGRLFEIRITDDTVFRISGARINEAWG